MLGKIGLSPRDFYATSMEDVALIFAGWRDKQREDAHWQRANTAVLGDVVNRSFGGKGAAKHILAILRLHGDSISDKVDERLKQRLLNRQKQLRNGSNSKT